MATPICFSALIRSALIRIPPDPFCSRQQSKWFQAITIRDSKTFSLALAVFFGFNMASNGQAAEPFLPKPILPGGQVLPLYPADSPLLNQAKLHEAEVENTSLKSPVDRVLNVINIHNPTIEVHLAPDDNLNTGTAIICAPGGGHKILWVGPEGADCVPLFAKRGISTIILRNRLRVDGYEPTVDAVNDALQAIRLVRSHAAEWKIDPLKIGIIGFSAGGELSTPAALFYEGFAQRIALPNDPLASISARPDFVAAIYPGPTPFTKSPSTPIPADVPPAFLASPASGDQIHALWANDYFTAMLKAGVPNIEMHLYGSGGHGGALSVKGIPFSTWTDRYFEWLADLGFLQEPGKLTKAARDAKDFQQKQAK